MQTGPAVRHPDISDKVQDRYELVLHLHWVHLPTVFGSIHPNNSSLHLVRYRMGSLIKQLEKDVQFVVERSFHSFLRTPGIGRQLLIFFGMAKNESG